MAPMTIICTANKNKGAAVLPRSTEMPVQILANKSLQKFPSRALTASIQNPTNISPTIEATDTRASQ